MRWSLVISIVIHVAIVLAAVIVLPKPEQYKVAKQEAIPVEIIQVTDQSKRQAKAKQPEKKKKQAANKPKIKPKVIVEKRIEKIDKNPDKQIKQAVREPVAEPRREAQPDEIKKLIENSEQPKQQPQPEPKPQEAKTEPAVKPAATPRPRTRPRNIRQLAKRQKKNAFQPDQIAALLNKTKDQRSAPPPPEDSSEPLAAKNNASGRDDRISASELDWLRQRLSQCWTIPAGVREAQTLVVRMRIKLDRAGMVIGEPQVLNFRPDPLFEIAARSAARAVRVCEPFDGLPTDRYDAWKDIIFNFDPSHMLAIN